MQTDRCCIFCDSPATPVAQRSFWPDRAAGATLPEPAASRYSSIARRTSDPERVHKKSRDYTGEIFTQQCAPAASDANLVTSTIQRDILIISGETISRKYFCTVWFTCAGVNPVASNQFRWYSKTFMTVGCQTENLTYSYIKIALKAFIKYNVITNVPVF